MGVNNISIINSAYSALEAASAGMTVTSQNVAGASVDGFTRRQSNSIISHRSLNSWDFGNTAFSVEGFSRFTDGLLDSQLRDQKSKSSYTASLLQTVNGLDTAMMDPANSIADAMSSFFNAAGTLASDTSSTTNIQNFAGSAVQVATRISTFADGINQLSASTRTNLTAILEQANSIAPALAKINLNILMGSVPGNATPSADILDERDRLTMQLQDLLGGHTIINSDGTATFQIGGMALVDGQTANKFVHTDVSNSLTEVSLRFGEGMNAFERPIFATGKAFIDSGQAGAAYTIVNDFIPKIKRQLSSITLAFTRDVNTTKRVNGTAITQIFGYTDTSSAHNVITTSPSAIGTYTAEQLMDISDPTSKNFNQSVANAVNDSKYDPTLFISNISTGANSNLMDSAAANLIEQTRSYYSNPLSLLTSNVSSTIASWKLQDKANVSIASQLNNRKQSISGVNLDEEAANLVKFQQLYGAASKVMQTANQMFATLLSAMNAA